MSTHQWIKLGVCGFLLFGAAGGVALIGKETKPTTPGVGAIVLLIRLAMIVLIWQL